MKPNLRTRLRRPSGWLLLLVLIVWSVLIGLGLSLAIGSENLAIAAHKSIDVIPEKTEFGQQTYLSSCATCHVPIPPQLLPTQRWAEILERPDQHFGVNLRNAESRGQGIPPVTNIDVRIMWDYVQQTSRVYREEEDLPSRLNNSRFFWALHPKIGATCQQNDIECPDRISVQTCNTCHTAARQFDYRQLTPEWENSL